MSKHNQERNSAFINEVIAQIEGLRLFGAGVRNYGFIEKTYEIAAENPNFILDKMVQAHA